MAQVTTLGKIAQHAGMQDHLFIDDYFVVIGESNDYYIKLNGFNQINNDLAVAYNLVNDQWYFKFVKAN